MNNEKQNNTLGWKERYLQWESSANDSSQQDVIPWEKLQSRLQASASRKKRYILPAAAAVMLIAGALILFNGKGLSKSIGSKIAFTLPKENIIPVVEKNNAVPVQEELVEKKSPVSSSTEIKNGQESQMGHISQIAIAESVVPVDTISVMSSVTVSPPKRKLKVIHINELNAPPPPVYADNKEWKRLQSLSDDEPLPEMSIWPGKNRRFVSPGN